MRKSQVRGVFHRERYPAAFRRHYIAKFASERNANRPNRQHAPFAASVEETDSHRLREPRHVYDPTTARKCRRFQSQPRRIMPPVKYCSAVTPSTTSG